MYAIMTTGGKQYKVAVGDTVYIEKLDAQADDTVSLDVMMLVNGKTVKIGTPLVNGVTVSGKVTKQVRGKKVIVFKYKPKKNIRKKNGHRQNYTAVEITAINTGK